VSKNNEIHKTIKIHHDVWLRLNYLKLGEDAKTISNIIKKLIEYYEKDK